MPTADNLELQRFVAEARPELLRAAVALCRDVPTAEDLVQTALVRVARRWGVARAAPVPYARKVLVNLVRDGARHAARHPSEPLTERHLHAWGKDDHTGGVDRRLVLIRALHELPERQRTVLVLRFYLDLSVAETARMLRLPPGTVKSATSRAIDRLGDLLARDDGGEASLPSDGACSAVLDARLPADPTTGGGRLSPTDDQADGLGRTKTGGNRC